MKWLLAVWLLAWGVFVQADELVIAAGEWPPYSGEHLQRNGTVLATLQDALAASGYTVRYEFMPWNRALELIRAGKYVATPMWLRTPDRERDFTLAGPLMVSVVVFFHRKDLNFSWNTLADVQALRIGVTNGYSYGPDFDRLAAAGSLNIDKAPTDEQNLVKLAGGHVDLFPLDRDVGNDMIGLSDQKAVREQLTFNAKPIHSEAAYLLISRKHPQADALARRFAAIWPKFRPAGVPTN
jgi:polar amino acid transport system substrate-binding protein